MGIPRELRDMILEKLLTTTNEIPINLHDTTISHPYSSDPHWESHCQYYVKPPLYSQILATCNQLYAEGSRLLYCNQGEKAKRILILPQNITRARSQFTYSQQRYQQRYQHQREA